MGYLDFLDLVLPEELPVRDDGRFRQGLRFSKLPHHKTLDAYDFSFQLERDPRKVKGLAALSFVEGKANAALLGSPEVGKTHIAVALAVAACRAGYSIYFTGLDDMDRNLKATETAGRLTNRLGTYLRPGVLMVDEVGCQPFERPGLLLETTHRP
jgi:DNA replication protein DnaC